MGLFSRPLPVAGALAVMCLLLGDSQVLPLPAISTGMLPTKNGSRAQSWVWAAPPGFFVAVGPSELRAAKSDDEQQQTHFYRGTGEMRSNPERGFRHELHPDENGTLTQLSLDQLRMFNLTVGQTYWYLPVEPVLSEQTLAGVSKTLRTLRGVGVKALFRFAYDRCNAPGGMGENNYTAATILGHIQQLKTRFQAEIDVVYVLQAGFVGCWGEWHGSRNLPDPFGPARSSVQQILHAELFDLLPPDRKVNLRYPALKFDVVLHRDCPQIAPSDANGHRSNLQCGGYNTSAPTGAAAPPPEEMAFGIATAFNFKENTAVARLGFDNDGFMGDQFGDGTWVGGAQHDGDVPRTTRRNPRTHQNDVRDGPNGQIPNSASYGDPLFNSVHGPMIECVPPRTLTAAPAATAPAAATAAAAAAAAAAGCGCMCLTDTTSDICAAVCLSNARSIAVLASSMRKMRVPTCPWITRWAG